MKNFYLLSLFIFLSIKFEFTNSCSCSPESKLNLPVVNFELLPITVTLAASPKSKAVFLSSGFILSASS